MDRMDRIKKDRAEIFYCCILSIPVNSFRRGTARSRYCSSIHEHGGVVGVAAEVAQEEPGEELWASGQQAGVGGGVPGGAEAVGGDDERGVLLPAVRPDAHLREARAGGSVRGDGAQGVG